MAAPPPELAVEIVAASRATVDGLAAYLTGAGVAVSTSAHVESLVEDERDIDAAVVFPDEIDPAQAADALAALRRVRPRLLLIVVTGAPQRYRPALEPDADSRLPIVLPRPAFGWAILDALRAHARESDR